MAQQEGFAGTMFQDGGARGRAPSPVPSVTEVSQGGQTGYGKGIYREDKTANLLRGRGPVPVDTRKFRYDVVRGKASRMEFSVDREDRMSADEAGMRLHQLHVIFGVQAEEDGFLKAFDDAMFFCHTLNSASVLTPGRSNFIVAGQSFPYRVVIDKLGVDLRRFFRAFADDVKDVNQLVIDQYDPYDAVKAERHGWLMQVAQEKGLQRHPHLAHDSSDACVRINMTERAAVINSKREVLTNVFNSADRMMTNPRVQSAENYDSTTGQQVSAV